MTPLGVDDMFQYWYQYVIFFVEKRLTDAGLFGGFVFQRSGWIVVHRLESGQIVSQVDGTLTLGGSDDRKNDD